MYSSVIKKRTSSCLIDPLPTLLFVLLGNSCINKFKSKSISKCIRICILVDILYSPNILYTPSYYNGNNKLKKKVLEDMESRNIISLEKNIFSYKYKIKDYELLNKINKEIKEYLSDSGYCIRRDTLILCLLYLSRFDLLDFDNKKINRIREYHKNKEECLQQLIK